jgi:hydrogenase expression/formation protein HypE
MTHNTDFSPSCPIPVTEYPEIVLAHGGGGGLTHQLIEKMILPSFANPFLNARHDGAVVNVGSSRIAFTTDSYVVNPHFFPGGDIGALAVNGTVNDLAMCGARPLYLSAGFILEEGFPMDDLWRVITSMKQNAEDVGVKLITGDTKVVDKGNGGGIFINTSGIGIIQSGLTISPEYILPGDSLILSGDLGRHGIAVMSAREGMEFERPIESDTAALMRPVQSLIDAGINVHCLRDLTRGGLATALVEVAEVAGVEVRIDEAVIPVSEAVRGASEIMGFDPLYVANEGRFVVFVSGEEEGRALEVLSADRVSQNACLIGHVFDGEAGLVTSKTMIGGHRALDMLSGEQLPRIC